MNDPFVIAEEPISDATSISLLEHYASEVATLLGEASCVTVAHDVASSAYRPPTGTFLVARARGVGVGCGALRRFDDDSAELRRLFVEATHRHLGVGRALLARLEMSALAMNYRRVVLDTSRHLTNARPLYLAAGYREIPPYNDNVAADFWFEKYLDPHLATS